MNDEIYKLQKQINQLEKVVNNNAQFILELCKCINVVRIPKGKVATLDDNR